jgi:hypothetical protein
MWEVSVIARLCAAVGEERRHSVKVGEAGEMANTTLVLHGAIPDVGVSVAARARPKPSNAYDPDDPPVLHFGR